MNREKLSRLHLDLNTLYYQLFDLLDEKNKRIIEAALTTIKEQLKGEF